VAARTQRLRRFADWHRRRWVLVVHALGLVSGIVWLIQGNWLVGGLILASFLYLLQMSFLFTRLADRAKAAEDKNRALAGTSAPPPT
jgi:hypothetical protein